MISASDNRTIVIDADGKSLGRVASRASTLLMGKRSPQYRPERVVAPKVVVINASKVYLTGNKEGSKTYKKYSGYPGGLRYAKYTQEKSLHPTRPLRVAIERMLPRNKLRPERMANLQIFAGEQQ